MKRISTLIKQQREMRIKEQCLLRICFVIAIVVILGCNNDAFWDTNRYLTTDKTNYGMGDTISLTLNIERFDDEKIIRVNRNFKNLSISFALVNRDFDVYNERWSHSSYETLPKSTIREIAITPDSPFRKTFKGLITPVEDSVEIQFADLNLYVRYAKHRLKRDSLRIHGFCSPINPSFTDPLEDYFEPKDIKINVYED